MKPTATIELRKHPITAVRRAGVPLAAFETSDMAQTIATSVKALNGKSETIPLIRWDCVKGLVALNPKGKLSLSSLLSNKSPKGTDADDAQALTTDPTYALNILRKGAGEKYMDTAIVFFLNGHLFIKNETVLQAMWNLRDEYKQVGSTLIVLTPSMELPDELSHDIVVVTEPLPNAAEVGAIFDSIAEDAKLPKLSAEDKEKVVDTLLGVSAFAAEQTLAMSIIPSATLTKDGKPVLELDRDELWERKRKMIEQTPGLSVFKDSASFDDIGGLANIKAFLTRILKSGNNPVRCIGFIDEIEKMFGGASGDLSGVSQDQLRVFLTEMQDNNIPGIILIGPPGTGKSAIAKGAGAVADAEVLTIDTGAMTGSLVGESQAKIRKAMATFKAVSQGKGLFIATCNKIAALPPELRRRFTLGTFYVDLPTDEERKVIWPLWIKKYGLDAKQKRPVDDGWTGAEIKACCDVAFRAAISLEDASTYVVPVSKSAADQIASLRRQASNKYISASSPGIYEYKEEQAKDTSTAGTKVGPRRFGQDS